MPTTPNTFTEPIWQNTVHVSNMAELLAAITASGLPGSTPTVIELQNDIIITRELSVGKNSVIKFTSGTGGPFKLDANGASRVLQNAGGTVYLKSIIITGGKSTANGGGIYNQSKGIIVMTGGAIAGNQATGGAIGGGIFNDNAAFTLEGGEIHDNTSGYYGGGVGNGYNGVFTMNGGMIDHNTSVYSGGGVENSATFKLNGGYIEYNKVTRSGDYGGGIFSNGSGAVFTMNSGYVRYNEASNGGGISAAGITGSIGYQMTGGTVSNNSATNGGGIYLLTVPPASIGGIVSNNTATSSGGGVFINNTTAAFNGASVYGNDAANGGGLFLGNLGTYVVTNSGIYNNTASQSGGGIYIPYSALAKLDVSSDVTFSGNRASTAYSRNPTDESTYSSHIFATRWTVPFVQGYNNYDISYTNGPVMAAVSVTISGTKRIVEN